MSDPKIRFLPGDKLTVVAGSIVIECGYWVQWGEQIWNVEITKVTGEPDDDASVAEIVVRALRKPAGKLILKRGNKLLWGASKIPASDCAGKVI